MYTTELPYSIGRLTAVFAILFVALSFIAAPAESTADFQNEPPASYIVQAADVETAVAAIQQVGGSLTHELGIINAVGAVLTPAQEVALTRINDDLSIYEDHSVMLNSESVTIKPSYAGWLKEASPNENNGLVKELLVRQKNDDSYRTVYYYNLSDLPVGASIISANAFFFVTQSNNQPVEIHRITDNWSGTNVTWGNMANNIDAHIENSFIPSGNKQYVNVNITQLVQVWVNGTQPNNGLMLEGTVEGAESKYTSFNWPINYEQPYLDIVYSTPAQQTVRDEFSAISYSGNDGTASWNGDWAEFGEVDGPSRGRIEVDYSSRCASGYCLEIGGDEVSLNGRGIQRAANLSGATLAELTFSYRRSGDEDGSINLQVSNDGGSWTTLATYDMSHNDSGQVLQSFDIAPFASANTHIRFIGNGGEIEGYLRIDDVTITYSTTTIPDIAHTEIIHANLTS